MPVGARSRRQDADDVIEDLDSRLALKEDQHHQASQALLQTHHELATARKNLSDAIKSKHQVRLQAPRSRQADKTCMTAVKRS